MTSAESRAMLLNKAHLSIGRDSGSGSREAMDNENVIGKSMWGSQSI